MPSKIVIMIPPGSGPGITHLASTPAMSPITINATMPMRFHLPCFKHFLLPPDGNRKRNITDAVPHATSARLTPLSLCINTKKALFCGLSQESRPSSAVDTKSRAKSVAAP
jgi:hypothetical protein